MEQADSAIPRSLPSQGRSVEIEKDNQETPKLLEETPALSVTPLITD